MKSKVALVLTGLWLLLPFVACRPPDTSSLAPPSPVAEKPTAPGKSEWDSLVEAAKREGSVVIYCTSIGESGEASSRAFREKYGINLEYVPGRGDQHVQRITTERNAGLSVVDAMLTGLGTFYNSISPMKITVPLEPLLVLPEVTDGSKWRTGGILFVDSAKTCAAFSVNSLPYTAVNTDMVREGEFASTEDVLSSKWNGKIVISDPSVSGNGAEWFTFIMLQAYGREKGPEYIQRLVKQEPALTRDLLLQAEWVARGKYLVGLGTETSHVNKMARAGAPIKLLAMKEGQPLTSGPMNLMVFDKAPHPNAVKLFANWALSQEGGTIFSKYSGYVSARRDVSTADFDPILVPGPKDILPGQEYKLEQGKLLKVASDLFKDLIR